MVLTQEPSKPVCFGDEALLGGQVRSEGEFYLIKLLELIYNKYFEWKWNWKPFFPVKETGGKNIYQSWDFKCFLLLQIAAMNWVSRFIKGKPL